MEQTEAGRGIRKPTPVTGRNPSWQLKYPQTKDSSTTLNQTKILSIDRQKKKEQLEGKVSVENAEKVYRVKFIIICFISHIASLSWRVTVVLTGYSCSAVPPTAPLCFLTAQSGKLMHWEKKLPCHRGESGPYFCVLQTSHWTTQANLKAQNAFWLQECIHTLGWEEAPFPLCIHGPGQ